MSAAATKALPSLTDFFSASICSSKDGALNYLFLPAATARAIQKAPDIIDAGTIKINHHALIISVSPML